MILQPSFFDRMEAEMQRREAAHGVWTPAGLRYSSNPERLLGGNHHDDKSIQKEIVEKVMDILGDEAWCYAQREGNSLLKLRSAWQSASELGHYGLVPYSTFYKWFHHYLLFGETMPETR